MLYDKINAFKKKIHLWINYINNEHFEIFSCFTEFFSDNANDVGKIRNFITSSHNLETNINIRFEKFPEKKLI